MILLKPWTNDFFLTPRFECINKETQAHTSFPIIYHHHQGLHSPHRPSEGLSVQEHANPLDCSDYDSSNQDVPVSGLPQERSKGIDSVETREEEKYFHREVLSGCI